MVPRMSREVIYDEQIAPLMRQIIALCKEHDIPMVSSFQYNDDRPDGEAALCTTVILPGGPASCAALQEAARVIYRPPTLTMLTVRDSKGQVTSMEAIVD